MRIEITRLMHSLLTQSAEPLPAHGWQPAMDVYRIRGGWLVKFDLAGVRPEDVQMQARGRCLIMKGRRRDYQVEEYQQHYYMEIAYSHFERTVELPSDLQHAQISTDYRDGMLFVRLLVEEAGT